MFIKRKKIDTFSLRVHLIKKSSVVCTKLPDGEAILLNSEDKYFYTLNETAFRIWNLIDNRRSISKIIEVLLREYDIDRLRVTRSIRRQIKEFIINGLIEAKG